MSKYIELKQHVYFENLDSIRFIAALMVLFSHALSESYVFIPIEYSVVTTFLNLVSNGGLGVSIFFVLSGFLITYLLIVERETKSKISLGNFYMRRILRIWPLYFAVIIFAFVAYPLAKSFIGIKGEGFANIMYHMVFLSNFDLIHMKQTNIDAIPTSQAINWSVSIEEQFYLFWPLIFAFLPKKMWLFSILSVIAISILFRMQNYENKDILYFHTLSVLLDLGIGGLFAFLVTQKKQAEEFFKNISTRTHCLFFVLFFGLIFYNQELFDFKYGLAIGRVFISFSIALIITAQAMTTSNTFLNLKNFKLGTYWGKYTYSIYLLHPICLTFSDVCSRVFNIPMVNFINTFIWGVLAIVLTFIVSKISYDYYESYFIRLKHKFSILK
ncbi:acyltransferase [uncultured Cytophaga sp.]|mgnify:CR=1 FL=1|uniref:acyltransferase family protein n=1 Tax=uncultured Cytophaga sp. TaxID=160238 RepID=UPI00261A031C|nr:acyltransferase [uncultured Cytophaga sp.]